MLGHNVLRERFKTRIVAGEWAPGALIPAEEDIATEYKCSRTTVNRALQALAEAGMLERKRGAGTRVKTALVKRAHFDISVVRHEVETAGGVYKHQLLLRKITQAPAYVKKRLNLGARQKALHLQTIHFADEQPHAYEDRWVNIDAAPRIIDAPFDEISANEWLVKNIPYTNGEIIFTAAQASKHITEIMATPIDAALMCVDRTTWLGETFVTTMKLFYKPGYALRTRI